MVLHRHRRGSLHPGGIGDRHKKVPAQRAGTFSVSKRPRRVRARRREKIGICFLRRHVRRRKQFSGRECGICPPEADKFCARRTASRSKKRQSHFFDSQKGSGPAGRNLFPCRIRRSRSAPAAPAGAAALRLAQLRQLTVGGGHELLEAILKGGGLRRGGLAPEAAAAVPAGPAAGPALSRGAGRGGGSMAFLMERLMRPFSSMPMTLTLTSCPSFK